MEIVKRTQLSPPLAKTVAIVLCLCFMAPIGRAAEPAGPAASGNAGAASVRVSDEAASTANVSTPDSPRALSAEELAELSERAEEPGAEVAGGALSNTHLTYIVIALAAAVIVLIAK